MLQIPAIQINYYAKNMQKIFQQLTILQYYLGQKYQYYFAHHIDFKRKKFVILLTMVCILLPKLFWPTMRKKCSGDRENF